VPPAPAATDSQQRPRVQVAAQSNVNVDGSEAMFTTMCALMASGFEGNVSSEKWHPLRAQLRERLRAQQGPAVDAVREFYKVHELRDAGSTLSRYVWFGLVAGPAPRFATTLKRDELPPEVISLEGFTEILANYYKEQHIGELWRQVQPIYNREFERLHESVSQLVFVSTGYLREILEPSNPRTFMIVVEPLVGRITNVRNFGDHYAIVLSGADDIPTDTIRHAFLHFLLDPLPLRYPHQIAVKRPLFERAAQAPRLSPELRDDFPSYFAENTVRAVELKLKKMSPGEREAAMNADDANGLVLVRPLFTALRKFEESEPSMALFFPDLVRAVDAGEEVKRIATVKFAPVDSAAPANEAEAEAVAKRRKEAHPTTVPNDSDAIAALTEGERRLAEKNPRAAEASFQRVLAKYPEQIRAWYGLGHVALLDDDTARAKQVFQRLTTGEHAATNDPMVMAWSHIYLGWIYDYEGLKEQAKAEFQAALAVADGPAAAKQAAQKSLTGGSASKGSDNP
jgi:tetratricopeptide (TPR) repeat protein